MTQQKDLAFCILASLMMSSVTQRADVMAQDDVSNSSSVDVNITFANTSEVGLDTDLELPNRLWSGSRLGGYCCGNFLNGICTFVSSECVNCTCSCIQGYTYVEGAIGRCEEVTSEGDSSPAVEGSDKLPLEACEEKSQCVEGLDCLDGVCACPSPCEYVPEQLVCDCGPQDTPWWPIVIGVLLGFLIVSFWIRTIAEMIEKHKRCRNNKVAQMTRSVSGISTLGAAYGTDHVTFQPLSKNYSQTSHLAVAPTSPLRPAFGTNERSTIVTIEKVESPTARSLGLSEILTASPKNTPPQG